MSSCPLMSWTAAPPRLAIKRGIWTGFGERHSLAVQMYSLIISNPPHQDEVDADLAAPSFGLTAADVRMKATYGAPEIWVMSTVKSKIEDAARTLREAGLNIVIASGEDLANIPAAATVKSFSFTDTYLVAKLEDLEVGLPYDAAIVAVFCKAPEGSPAELTLPAGSALLDIYGTRKGEVLKMSFVQEVVDFSGLGDVAHVGPLDVLDQEGGRFDDVGDG